MTFSNIRLSFSLQIGLMYRQIGPIIISMSYMMMDVFVFLFIFVIVYISFTLCTVYVYGVYEEDRQEAILLQIKSSRQVITVHRLHEQKA